MKYDPFNVKHSSGTPLAYQAATHDDEYGQDFAAAEEARAEEARAEELSRAQEDQADAQAEAERYQDWTPCQMYGHEVIPVTGLCADCGEQVVF
jgi:hypothetical protein